MPEAIHFPLSFWGHEQKVPVLDGSIKPYVNLDNAASTPSMRIVMERVEQYLTYYSSVHRGTGFKSQLSTHAYEQARLAVMDFVGADPRWFTCIFGKNTTEASNKLARRFPFTDQRNVVLVSTMEHHSNDLPWRAAAHVIHIGVTPEGELDEEDFDQKLAQYREKIALVAITGASNVTGYINPIHRLAEKAHTAGAQIAVDCAQLAPHRAIQMGSLDDPSHIDYVFLSAHKLYAPFGSGALVGRIDTFSKGDPDMRGGGEVEIVTLDDVQWSNPPERDEAGSPNTVGAVAFGVAVRALQNFGMQNVADHEAGLTAYTLRRLLEIPGIQIYGDNNPDKASQRLGVIPINLPGKSHFLVASILGYEYGIGVRNGCFCAHPYLLQLMGITGEHAMEVREAIFRADRRDMPGMVRISFGLYNQTSDIDRLISALTEIANGKYRGKYIQDQASGEYHPEGWQIDFDNYFKL